METIQIHIAGQAFGRMTNSYLLQQATINKRLPQESFPMTQNQFSFLPRCYLGWEAPGDDTIQKAAWRFANLLRFSSRIV